MKPIEFKHQNVIIAKDQPEYENLPAYVQENGMVLFGFELNDKDLELTEERGYLDIIRLTFNQPAQPTKVFLSKEIQIPLDHTMSFDNVTGWNDKKDEATIRISLDEFDRELLKKNRALWVVTCTLKSPLQPVKLMI